ncbi:MAG: endolytic transglycosylase MltG [Rhizobiales bacterium]|nr:endolytic transglycosylase MltG [Hyphomicrobiales bacterium]
MFLSLFSGVLVIALAGGIAATYGYREYIRPGPLAIAKALEIEKGLGTSGIAAKLEKEGVIVNAEAFSTAVILTGSRGRLKAGEYEFPAASTMREVLDLLVSGKSLIYKVSIPEGWTSAMAMARIDGDPVLKGGATTPPPEGAIMPDTYVFKRGMTRHQLLEDMQKAQTKLLDEIWATRKSGLAIRSKEEAVILASIVEKETGLASERPLIASVFMNRLAKGMRLQSDPTIIYGIAGGKGKLDRPLTKADITTPTPYNTYTINGLPPGPIANPGRAALEAVVNPPPTAYLYFVANGTGGHAFAATLEEHNRNVTKWRNIEGNAANAAAAEEAESVETAPQPAPVKIEQTVRPGSETPAVTRAVQKDTASGKKAAKTKSNSRPASRRARIPNPWPKSER